MCMVVSSVCVVKSCEAGIMVSGGGDLMFCWVHVGNLVSCMHGVHRYSVLGA